MSKPPLLKDECYYEEDSYAVNEQKGGSDRVPKAQIRIIDANVKTIVTITVRVIMSEIETTTATTTSTGVTMVT